MNFANDPIGYAIQDFDQQKAADHIVVQSDLCEDDVLPIPYLFREFDDMPEIEQFALSQCEGRVLDIGAGAGCHSMYLKEKGYDVLAIDRSQGACAYLTDYGITAVHKDFMEYSGEQFDTILLLMNGIGLAGSLDRLPTVLKHLKSLLKTDGKIYCDSTDIHYMYSNDDGSVWMDLNAQYYGEMNFNMVYKDVESGWFPWLYVDQEKLTQCAKKAGFRTEILIESTNNHYLAELKTDQV